jgi:uncharacterized membrane protein YfcA
MTSLLLVLIGIGGGVLVGLLGVGGGILFVPTLVLLVELSQVEAEGTSLLAILPAALVGAFRQYRYGNLQLRAGAVLGLMSLGGVIVGVASANLLPDRILRIVFAAFLFIIAAQLLRHVLRSEL